MAQWFKGSPSWIQSYNPKIGYTCLCIYLCFSILVHPFLSPSLQWSLHLGEFSLAAFPFPYTFTNSNLLTLVTCPYSICSGECSVTFTTLSQSVPINLCSGVHKFYFFIMFNLYVYIPLCGDLFSFKLLILWFISWKDNIATWFSKNPFITAKYYQPMMSYWKGTIFRSYRSSFFFFSGRQLDLLVYRCIYRWRAKPSA